MTSDIVSWSQLINTTMGEYVASRMSNPSLTYHNFGHIQRLYAKAAEWNLPYDINLDCAILWHDSVYDALPDKELRSAELVRETYFTMPHWFDDIDLPEVTSMILNTMSHNVMPEVNSLMLKLDLAELGDSLRMKENFWSILQESQNLYEIGVSDAAKGTLDFMAVFAIVMDKNHNDDFHSEQFIGDGDEYWTKVCDGVKITSIMASTIIELFAQGYAKLP